MAAWVKGSSQHLLKAAHELGGPQIKRFVLLSGIAAAIEPFKQAEEKPDAPDYTEETWNPV